MAARMFRLFLAGELGFYLLSGFFLVRNAAWAPEKAIVAMFLLALAGRALVVAVTFGFARIYAAPPPAGLRIGVGRAAAMALREYLAFVLLFSVIQPFEGFFLGKDRLVRVPAGRSPVLLVHGYQCNRGFWLWLRRALERAGWCVATISLEPVFNDIDAYADQVARRIKEVCAATGAPRVILVGHSMGGLVSRAYLRRYGNARVAKLITLGTPHHGSRLAHLGIGENGRQMRPGGTWLPGLNAPGVATLPEAAVSIYSCHDNYVMPQDSSLLEGAKNLPLAGIGHLEMAFSPVVERLLLAELE